MIYLFINISLFLLFLFFIFLFFPEEFFFVTLLVTVCEFLRILLLAVTLFNDVYIFCSTYSICFLFHLYNLYYCAHIYHSCSTFPWFGVSITASLIQFLRFYWIVHSLYRTWMIACPRFFSYSTYQYCHLSCLQGFQWCSCIFWVGWKGCGSSFPHHE